MSMHVTMSRARPRPTNLVINHAIRLLFVTPTAVKLDVEEARKPLRVFAVLFTGRQKSVFTMIITM